MTMGELPPTRNANEAIFACDDGHVFTLSDVVVAAHFRGELQDSWRRLLARVAADEEAADRDFEADDDALQELSDSFRSDRDLITAEETESWLEKRGLTLEDFNDYFVREYWGGALGAKVEAEMIDYVDASDEQRELLTVELLLSGDFDRMATALSWRVAAHRAAVGGPIEGAAISAERVLFLKAAELDEEKLATWLHGVGRDAGWLEEMLALNAAYRRAQATLVTDELCRAELAARRIQFAQIDVETIELESRNAASEALLCVRNDGMSLAEVAAESSYPHHRATLLLEDLPANLHERVLCAAPGRTA